MKVLPEKIKEIAIISDIHSNAIALEIVLNNLKRLDIDLCIVLGDLLTYGAEPNEVIELLKSFQLNMDCIFIKGNHDQFYFDISNGVNPINYKMPDFIEESIMWTAKKLDYDLQNTFNWQNYFRIDDVYFAHANPFEYRDWTYLNTDLEFKTAFKQMSLDGIQIGVFGHTHRYMKRAINEKKNIKEVEKDYVLKNQESLIMNSGSVGQPRGCGLSYVILNKVKKTTVYYDLPMREIKEVMRKKIFETNISNKSKSKILSYWDD